MRLNTKSTSWFNLYHSDLQKAGGEGFADPDQTPHYVASDQGLYYLLSEFSIKTE